MINNNFYTVFYWMINELGLRGNELPIFAIIYSFSQDGVNKFSGSLNYLSKFANVSKQTVITTIKNLVEKKLIIKTKEIINGVQINSYSVNLEVVKNFELGSQNSLMGQSNIFNEGSQNSLMGQSKIFNGGSQNFLPNNKYNNKYIESNIYIPLNLPIDLQKSLTDFCEMREKIKSPITERGIKLLLDKLEKLAPGDYKKQNMLLEQSIMNGWKSVYPLKEYEKVDIDKTYDIDDINQKAMLNDDFDI